MKRFYTLVSVTKSAAGYNVLLDGKPINTPYKNVLSAPSEGLANEIVQEWSEQEDVIVPDTMPLTQILSTKIDRVSQERSAMSVGVLKYFNTDLLCYRADDPPEITAAQIEEWDPVVEWFAERFGEGLKTTKGLVALQQPEELHNAVRTYVEGLDDHKFALLQLVTATSGSIILALAFIEKEVGAKKIFACTHVEENFKAKLYNEEKYGPDPAQETKDKAMMVDLEAAEKYLNLMNA